MRVADVLLGGDWMRLWCRHLAPRYWMVRLLVDSLQHDNGVPAAVVGHQQVTLRLAGSSQ